MGWSDHFRDVHEKAEELQRLREHYEDQGGEDWNHQGGSIFQTDALAIAVEHLREARDHIAYATWMFPWLVVEDEEERERAADLLEEVDSAVSARDLRGESGSEMPHEAFAELMELGRDAVRESDDLTDETKERLVTALNGWLRVHEEMQWLASEED